MFNYNLFTRPSFLSGMSRVLDIGSVFNRYNESKAPEEADIKALMSDWLAIGMDLQDSINIYDKTLQKQ